MVRYIIHVSSIVSSASYFGFLEAICAYFILSSCPIPAPAPFNLTTWFTKPKPSNYFSPVPPVDGKRLRVLHMSDFHIDPRKLNVNRRAYPVPSKESFF